MRELRMPIRIESITLSKYPSDLTNYIHNTVTLLKAESCVDISLESYSSANHIEVVQNLGVSKPIRVAKPIII